MKRTIYSLALGLLLTSTLFFSACVDDIKFGSAFLEKASGSTATMDTVFNSATYTQQFLNAIYSLQYFGLPYNNGSSSTPNSANLYTGKWEALSDCCHLNWSGCNLYTYYYGGTLTASYGFRGVVFHYTMDYVWEAVRWAWILIENVDRVPDLDESEKARMIAEAKCLIAVRYFDMFRHYGGLPIIDYSFTGSESSYDCPRGTVEETVDFMVDLLDDAINSGAMPWAYADSDSHSAYTGRWTTAGAMALKCKILQFAASPLFNDTQGYYGGGSEAEKEHLVWYGNYDAARWTRCYQACKEFFDALDNNGWYKLWTVEDASPSTDNVGAQYRFAYRTAYYLQGSPEVIHSTRVTTSNPNSSSTYSWQMWQAEGTCDTGMFGQNNVRRLNYSPTQEYIEMFPWSDGRPFDWDDLERNGDLDTMFIKSTGEYENITEEPYDYRIKDGGILTRDPRLYETARLNGMRTALDMTSGGMTGYPFEVYVGGGHSLQEQVTQTGLYGTGYANMKYYLGTESTTLYGQWCTLRLSDLMLTYAEAALQANSDYTTCIKYIDEVRARVGLHGIVECNPTKNLTSNKQNLLDELLRERACELGMEDSRYFDMVRYKMKDRFEMVLHGLLTYRLNDDGTINQSSWYDNGEYETTPQPMHFSYEKFEISSPTRYWWKYGFDPKWYLQPFLQTEINKGYGLIQNPGW